MRALPFAESQRDQTSTQTLQENATKFQRRILNEEKDKDGANQKKGGDGLVGPAVLLQEVADHETDAEEGDEHRDGDYGGGS